MLQDTAFVPAGLAPLGTDVCVACLPTGVSPKGTKSLSSAALGFQRAAS